MSEVEPVRINVPPEPPRVTPPAVPPRVPVPATSVMVMSDEPASESLSVTVDRSTLLARSSFTKTSVGNPLIDGSSFNAVTEIVRVSEFNSGSLSVAVKVMVLFEVPGLSEVLLYRIDCNIS